MDRPLISVPRTEKPSKRPPMAQLARRTTLRTWPTNVDAGSNPARGTVEQHGQRHASQSERLRAELIRAGIGPWQVALSDHVRKGAYPPKTRRMKVRSPSWCDSSLHLDLSLWQVNRQVCRCKALDRGVTADSVRVSPACRHLDARGHS